MTIRIKKPQDLASAVLFIALGIIGLWFGKNYNFGTLARMGPGFFPIVLSWLLIIFGVVIAALACSFKEGPAISPTNWRGLITIIVSILLFGFLINDAGLALTVLLVPLLASAATPQVRWKEAIILALLLSIACVLVFVYGLRQPFNVFFGG